MDEFRFSKKANATVTLKICDEVYEFNCSPTNYSFIKKVAALSREADNILGKISGHKAGSVEDWAEQSEFLRQKEQEIIETLLPGKWDELFKLANEDLLDMAELIAFIAERINAKSLEVRAEAIKPAIPVNAPEI